MNGEVTQRLTHPGFEHEKEYLVATGVKLAEQDIRRLEQGIQLEDGITCPATIKEVNIKPFDYSITFTKAESARCAACSSIWAAMCFALKRIRMGSLQLGQLQPGEVRELSPGEVRQLRKSAGLH